MDVIDLAYLLIEVNIKTFQLIFLNLPFFTYIKLLVLPLTESDLKKGETQFLLFIYLLLICLCNLAPSWDVAFLCMSVHSIFVIIMIELHFSFRNVKAYKEVTQPNIIELQRNS